MGANAAFLDDESPEVTARVARISVIEGEAQIRRAETEDNSAEWERVTQNLPLVEGDEITTSADARLEIQFDRNTYLRLGESSYLKIVTLRDGGIAVSLPQGVLNLNLLRFDKDRSFFEIDAPATTIAAQKTGSYTVAAGDERSTEVAVTANDGGEARVYSTNSGFTLRDGRMARVTIGGAYAGEWDMQAAPRFTDDFGEWIAERNAIVRERLRNAKYDEYYTEDFYGAEDLSNSGEWLYTQDYGYVWRPFDNVISRYDNWSPYRYGQWRWVPYYGWTWVNDEPWGWATYHHGRWVYYRGRWVWTPYSYGRAHRSYWRPAIVIFTTWGNNYCWYPLPYGYNYYSYNHYYHNRRKKVIINNTTIINNYPTPTPTPTVAGNPLTIKGPNANIPLGQIPAGAVVTVPTDRFGRLGNQGFPTLPEATGKQVISKTPERLDTPPVLPTRNELDGKLTKEIRAEQPPIVIKTEQGNVKTGATVRNANVPLDTKLRETKIFGDREPVVRQPNTETKTTNESLTPPGTRKTGAVTRPEVFPGNNGGTNANPRRDTGSNGFPNGSGETKNSDSGTTRDTRPTRQPTFDPPPRSEPSPPKTNPPPRSEPPRRPDRQPTFDPPPRSEPPPPKSDPPPKASPPQKTEPAPERKTPPSLAPDKSDGKDA